MLYFLAVLAAKIRNRRGFLSLAPSLGGLCDAPLRPSSVSQPRHYSAFVFTVACAAANDEDHETSLIVLGKIASVINLSEI